MAKKAKTAKTRESKKAEEFYPVPKGTLLLIGGKEKKGIESEEGEPDKGDLEILEQFVKLIKKSNPKIELVTTASSVPDEVFEDYKKAFQTVGVKDIGHIHHKSRNEIFDDDTVKRIKAADGVFFSGGDQLILTSIYGGSTFLYELKKRYINERIVVAGTSAGAMAMSTPMIYAGSKEVEQITGEIKITTGLEFLKDVCIDTHFVHRGRFVRMAQVIITNPTSIGIGLEEDTAIIVTNGLDAEVIGSGMIIIIDGFHIIDSNITEFVEKKAVSVRNLRVHILGKGDKYRIPQCNPPHV